MLTKPLGIRRKYLPSSSETAKPTLCFLESSATTSANGIGFPVVLSKTTPYGLGPNPIILNTVMAPNINATTIVNVVGLIHIDIGTKTALIINATFENPL